MHFLGVGMNFGGKSFSGSKLILVGTREVIFRFTSKFKVKLPFIIEKNIDKITNNIVTDF